MLSWHISAGYCLHDIDKKKKVQSGPNAEQDNEYENIFLALVFHKQLHGYKLLKLVLIWSQLIMLVVVGILSKK